MKKEDMISSYSCCETIVNKNYHISTISTKSVTSHLDHLSHFIYKTWTEEVTPFFANPKSANLICPFESIIFIKIIIQLSLFIIINNTQILWYVSFIIFILLERVERKWNQSISKIKNINLKNQSPNKIFSGFKSR